MRPSAELLIAAAKTLEDGGIPLCESFLREHQVTLDQAYSLAEQLAVGARMVAEAINDPQSEVGRAYFMTLARL